VRYRITGKSESEDRKTRDVAFAWRHEVNLEGRNDVNTESAPHNEGFEVHGTSTNVNLHSCVYA
jgi:hypothetical protein